MRNPIKQLCPSLALLAVIITCAAASSDSQDEKALRRQQMERVKQFSEAKAKQAAVSGDEIPAVVSHYFDVASKGDWETVKQLFSGLKNPLSENADLHGKTYWPAVPEIYMAYDNVINFDPKYAQIFVDDIINSIPPGSIYFGGTDPGRGLITAFTKSHADGDPFFTVTQNALADNSYLDYVRRIYGAKIKVPSSEDSQRAFSDYMTDAQQRLDHDRDFPNDRPQVKPGEDIKRTPDGRVQVSGQVSVMQINANLVKDIFDQNRDRQFYVEESFPLDWMDPYLEPHGLIMKLNRERLPRLSDEMLEKDHEYWHKRVSGMVGDWLTPQTTMKEVADFIEKVYVRKNLSGFNGDPAYVTNEYACKTFSKLRTSIGGVYDWRFRQELMTLERERMARETDRAYRQAFVLCPYSPEAVFRYVNFLLATGRVDDAILVASAGSKTDPKNETFASALKQLEKIKKR